MHTTQDRTAPALPDIQRPTYAPITVTVEVPSDHHAPTPIPTRPAVSNWERFLAFLAMGGVLGMVLIPAGIMIGRNSATAEINQANGARSAAEATLNANRAKIREFCQGVK